MKMSASHKTLFVISGVFLLILSCLGLVRGEVQTSLSDVQEAFFHYSDSDLRHIVIQEFRLPRVAMAIIAGASLSAAGMLMQTLFQNPLAGPYVLGINSGSSLLVALGTLSGISFFSTEVGVIGSALLGAFIFGVFILLSSVYLRNQISLLLFGIMLGSFVSAIITILQVTAHAQSLKAFTLWSMGSLQAVELRQIPLILVVFVIAIVLSFLIVKPLNILVLGEEAVKLMGYRVKRLRWMIVLITALFTGLVTAYCGPIAFVGLAVPNLSRILLKTQRHGILLFANLLFGALFLVACDALIQLFSNSMLIPINGLTSLIGAPFVIFILIKKLK